jgi:hypothetical protein
VGEWDGRRGGLVSVVERELGKGFGEKLCDTKFCSCP